MAAKVHDNQITIGDQLKVHFTLKCTESFCYKFAWRVEEVKMFGLGDSV